MKVIKHTPPSSQAMARWVNVHIESIMENALLPRRCTQKELWSILKTFPYENVKNGWIVSQGPDAMDFIFYRKPQTKRVIYETDK